MKNRLVLRVVNQVSRELAMREYSAIRRRLLAEADRLAAEGLAPERIAEILRARTCTRARGRP